MNYQVEMPNIVPSKLSKDNLLGFVPYLVLNTKTNEQSTILLVR